MKRRKGNLRKRMLALLLAVVMTAGMVSNAAPMTVLAAPAPQADIIDGSESEGWTLDADGKLTISSNDGMTDWIRSRNNEYNGTAYKLLVKSVVLQKGVQNIIGNAFNDCSGLTEIMIPDSVDVIGDSAFSGCSGLKEITIPESVRTIMNSAFSGCSGLTEITIPANVTIIEEDVFNNCSGLKEITIPANVTSIRYSAFSGCSGLTEIAIPANVTSIGDSAFSGCSGLTEITIPANVTSIGDSAFSGCSGLTEITIPANVTSIERYVFHSCSRLEKIIMQGETPPEVTNYTFAGSKIVTENAQGIRVPAGKEQAYKDAWPDWADYIRDQHKQHGDVTFAAWTETDSLPASGAYYLTNDVTVSGQTTISDTLTLCLNGCKIDAKQSGRIFKIESGGSLTLYDCDSGKKGMLTGGSIDDGNGGGAVYVDGGSFTMNGGTIAGNIAANGSGGGIHVYNSGTFTMNGGTITGNIAANGGGIYASFTSSQKGSITLDGAVDITGNTKADGTASNIYLDKNIFDASISKLTIGSGFSANTPIGVSIVTSPTSCANPVIVATGTVNAEVYEKFTSEMSSDSGCSLRYTNSVIQFELPHEYDNDSDMICNICGYDRTPPDTQPPTGKIEIEDNSWTSLLNAITFGLFFNETKNVTITAEDTGSGVDQIYYYISDGDMTEAQVKALAADAWTEGHSFSINPDKKCVIYAKITDKAGNTTYLSSNGLVFDKTAPVITGVKNGETYNTSQTVTVTDALSGVKSVTVDGTEVPLTDHQFTLRTAENPQTIVATDKAGNTATVTVTVKSHTHNLTLTPAKSATCTEDGNKAYYTCDSCDQWFWDAEGTQKITNKDSVGISQTGHSYDKSAWGYQTAEGHAHKCPNCDAHDTVQPHTPGAAATAESPQTCTVCGYIMAPATGTPSPQPTETPTAQPTVTPSLQPTEAPTAQPTEAPTAQPTETPTAQPTNTPKPDESGQTGNQIEKRKDLSLLLATGKQSGKSGIKLNWTKYKNISGYEVYWSYCDDKNDYKKAKTIKASGKRTWFHKKLKSNRTYKYFITAYKIVDGKKYYITKSPTIHVAMKYDKQTNIRKIKVNKAKVTLKKGKTFRIKTKLSLENRKKKALSHVAKLRYYTDNSKAAVVSKKGKITAKGKGTCTIYVIANNGVSKKIKVTVK